MLDSTDQRSGLRLLRKDGREYTQMAAGLRQIVVDSRVVYKLGIHSGLSLQPFGKALQLQLLCPATCGLASNAALPIYVGYLQMQFK